MRGSILRGSASANSFIHHIRAAPQTDACWGKRRKARATITSDGSRQSRAHAMGTPLVHKTVALMTTLSLWNCVWLCTSPSSSHFSSNSTHFLPSNKIITCDYIKKFKQQWRNAPHRQQGHGCLHQNFFPSTLLSASTCVCLCERDKKRQTTWYSDLANMAFDMNGLIVSAEMQLPWLFFLFLLFCSRSCLMLHCLLNRDVISDGQKWQEAWWEGCLV